MKFFDIQIRNITAYGIIYSNGVFEVSMWDFSADDYWYREGKLESMQAAWRQVHHLMRDMDRFNHYIDPEAGKDVDAAIDDLLDFLNDDEDFEMALQELDNCFLDDEE